MRFRKLRRLCAGLSSVGEAAAEGAEDEALAAMAAEYPDCGQAVSEVLRVSAWEWELVVREAA